jgi:phage/plasmid-like protein (TIGR03299 family)
MLTFEDQKVLYRSDNGAALSVVGDRYNVVQPRDVLEFYRDLTASFGYELETAGVLKGGRKLWALARTGQDAMLKNQDAVLSYLLLATSCDGTLATMAMPTTVRVVCNNTLQIALRGATNAVKVPHSTTFDPMAVKHQLGLATSSWAAFLYRIQTMAARRVKSHEASAFFERVCKLADPAPASSQTNARAMKRMQELFDGQGRGAELSTAKSTAWGLLNAVTEYVDHERRARSREYRLDSAWFGQGAALKQRGFDAALDLIA